MQYTQLGWSDEKVSRICLGSMTWGVQNTQQQADHQIEIALAEGINFIDTAELYPVPPAADKYGDTERIIGNWLARNPTRRKEFILASKISGNGIPWIREGADIDGSWVIKSVDASLQRLQTDYIDLFQLHWPNRVSPHFSKHRPNHVRFSDADGTAHTQQMLEILQALNECINAGKIRYCGLSDDTTWGISQYLKLSEQHNLPRMVSIQNEFNILHHKDWPYLIEHCIHDEVAFLPWSPLAGGILSGKYLNGQRPEGSRWSMPQRNGLFRDKPMVHEAVAELKSIADKNNMTCAQLSLAWCDQVDGVTSTIIGATTEQQLKENLAAFDIQLSEEIINDINSVINRYPAPF
jgi:aryl-alcohol dehydrogenase-like predicted oxidoreductase